MKKIVLTFTIILASTFPQICIAQTKNENNTTTELSRISEQEILKRNREMERAFEDNDFLKLGKFYTDDAVMVGDKFEIKGRGAVDNYWESLQDKGVSWTLENLQIETDGNLAFQRGISRLKFLYDGKEIQSDTRFTLIWKKIKGVWYITVDHYSFI